MNKICTDIEQSKKLMELGIGRKTSDMFYWCGEDLRIGGYRAQEEMGDIPAWSLSALLDILPNNELISITISRGGWKIVSTEYVPDTWWCEYEDEENDKVITTSANNPIDACVEMIVKLKEKGIL